MLSCGFWRCKNAAFIVWLRRNLVPDFFFFFFSESRTFLCGSSVPSLSEFPDAARNSSVKSCDKPACTLSDMRETPTYRHKLTTLCYSTWFYVSVLNKEKPTCYLWQFASWMRFIITIGSTKHPWLNMCLFLACCFWLLSLAAALDAFRSNFTNLLWILFLLIETDFLN